MTAITFDLDGTLVDRGATVAAFAGRFVDFYDTQLLSESAEVARAIQAADRSGYAARRDVCAALADQLRWHRPIPVAALMAFWHRAFPDCAVAAEGAIELLAALREARCRIGLVSNGAGDTQRRKLKAIGAEDLFDTITISAELGVRKPAPAIFETALRQLGSTSVGAWHIGDHPAYDIDGARRAGMRSVWVAGPQPWPTGLERPDRSVTHLSEIPAVLGLDRLYDSACAR